MEDDPLEKPLTAVQRRFKRVQRNEKIITFWIRKHGINKNSFEKGVIDFILRFHGFVEVKKTNPSPSLPNSKKHSLHGIITTIYEYGSKKKALC